MARTAWSTSPILRANRDPEELDGVRVDNFADGVDAVLGTAVGVLRGRRSSVLSVWDLCQVEVADDDDVVATELRVDLRNPG